MTSSGLVQHFERKFDVSPKIFRAPERVNLIGEHTDYNDGFVMRCAIGLSAQIAISRRADRKLIVCSESFFEEYEFDVCNLPGHRTGNSWAVAWNLTTPHFLVQEPPRADNRCIGCIGTAVSKGGEPSGIIDSLGTHVTPASLYLEQLRERLGDAALANIGYADSTIAVTPNTQIIPAGSSASFTVNLAAQDIYTGNVTLSVTGL